MKLLTIKQKVFQSFFFLHFPCSGQIKSDKDVRDNPYADPVDFQTQYTVVQKNWETTAKSSNDKDSSNPSNLMNNTDSSSTGNPSSPPETTNPKNSLSDENTPGLTETSETIPKPPNVYGFILFMFSNAISFCIHISKFKM